EITALDILTAVEISLFEPTQETVTEAAPEIDKALRAAVFEVLDQTVSDVLRKITLADLVQETEKHKESQAMMFYI
ncbi:MAG TPA: Rrf2 family transcriptional regulator, partial [Clostridia bacterium]|nr:Rrf2 family transcriptional regulator [Clostridia bacterium]